MAVVPQAGYQVDPNNPNAVVPIGTPNPFATNISYGAVQQNPTPAPQQPAVNPNQSFNTQGGMSPIQQPAQQPAQQPQQGQPQQGAAAMPANGSIIDLLKGLGMDSSQSARKALAQQYGVQNYDFSGAKNTELANKFLEAYNANKDKTAPQSEAEAMTATEGMFEAANEANNKPVESFMDMYFGMNPILKTFYDTMNQVVSSAGTRTSLVQEFQNLQAQEGLPALKTELLDINRIIDGTEDDIRDEVTAVGGFVTESQVQSMTMARNKTLLKRAASIQATIDQKEDFINQIMELTGADREAAERDMDRKLGIAEKMYTTFNSMQNAAAENYRSLVSQIGYEGLSKALQGNPMMQSYAENALGLPMGALSDKEFLAHASSFGQEKWSEPYQLGGDYVQKNLQTGEIRTAVNVATGTGEGGGGMTIDLSGEDWSAFVGVVGNTGSSVYQQKSMREGLSRALQSNDWTTAYQYVSQGTQNTLSGENKTKFQNAEIDSTVLTDLRDAISEYKAMGGDMNLLKGVALDSGKRLGVLVGDPRYAEIATQIDRVFQQYRQNMTGAAFGAQESAQYQRVIPNKSGSFDLNDSIINGALDYMNSYVNGAIRSSVGPQGVEVRNLALGGTAGGSSSNTPQMSVDDAYAAYLDKIKK